MHHHLRLLRPDTRGWIETTELGPEPRTPGVARRGLAHSGTRTRGLAWTQSQAGSAVADAGEGSMQTSRGGGYAGSRLDHRTGWEGAT